jgi:hypothetical protein
MRLSGNDEWIDIDDQNDSCLSSTFAIPVDLTEATSTTEQITPIFVRYRIKTTANEWSDFSPTSTIIGATGIPQAPPAPTFASADSSSISLTIHRSEYTVGAELIEYKLLIND